MKHLQLPGCLIIAFNLLISGCSAASPSATVTPVRSTDTPAVVSLTASTVALSKTPDNTPSPTQTITSTAIPSATVFVKTSTSTSTPTLDTRHLLTSTPEPKAECPKTDPVGPAPTLEYNHQFFMYLDDPAIYLNYLNKYGDQALIKADLTTVDLQGNPWNHFTYYRDLTHDGVPEIVMTLGRMYIFGCQNGEYKTLLAPPYGEDTTDWTDQEIVSIQDLNQNGVPEIFIMTGQYHGDEVKDYQLYEWNGGHFVNLFQPSTSLTPPPSSGSDYFVKLLDGKFTFQDIDQDGMKEIVLRNGIVATDYNLWAPWRQWTEYYKWNGETFTLIDWAFDPPQYRFQAVNDADHAVQMHEYDRALTLYQEVIDSKNLEWWSEERKNFILYNDPVYRGEETTILATPTPDPDEYPHLAAYAQYRLMILHILRGSPSEAQSVYQDLVKRYPEGTPGSIYAQMAEVFWTEYQTSHSIKNACSASISEPYLHGYKDEAVKYLWNNYTDGWIRPYKIEELCPSDMTP